MYQEVGQDVFDLLIHLFGTRRLDRVELIQEAVGSWDRAELIQEAVGSCQATALIGCSIREAARTFLRDARLVRQTWTAVLGLTIDATNVVVAVRGGVGRSDVCCIYACCCWLRT